MALESRPSGPSNVSVIPGGRHGRMHKRKLGSLSKADRPELRDPTYCLFLSISACRLATGMSVEAPILTISMSPEAINS